MKNRRRKPNRLQRRSAGRAKKTTILLVVEGEKTEPNYFWGLKQNALADRYSLTVKEGPGGSPEAVVKEAIKQKRIATNDFDEVWCVLDVETPDKRDRLDDAVKLAGQNKIKPCLSNPSFEVWFLAHFEKRARAYQNCDKVIVQLNKHWQNHYQQDYQKGDDHLYRRLSPHTQKAIDNARWVRETHHQDKMNTADANSSTEVYRLVEKLLG